MLVFGATDIFVLVSDVLDTVCFMFYLMMSNPQYFTRASGILMPSGVWLFSNRAAMMRGRARAEPLRVWQSSFFLPSVTL